MPASKKVNAEALTSADFEQRIAQPKILLFDIETAPNLSWVFGHYEQNVLRHEQERFMLSFAAKWLGEKRIICKSLPEYKGYKPYKDCDKGLTQDLWNLFDEADILIGHHLDGFDVKMANARFIKYRMNPPRFYKTIDTKKVAKRYFRFNSNKLDDLGNFLGVGRKVKHQGLDLWFDCLAGLKPAWATMCRYNKGDVTLLEKVYLELRKWHESHPNLNVLMNRANGCPKCGGTNIEHRGYRPTDTGRFRRYYCFDCGGYGQGFHVKVSNIR